jgi:hypothetical protein
MLLLDNGYGMYRYFSRTVRTYSTCGESPLEGTFYPETSVADPQHFNADPDPDQLFTLLQIQIRIQMFTLIRIRIQLFTSMQIRIQLFTLMCIRILILLLIKAMRICNHWSTGPPGLHF